MDEDKEARENELLALESILESSAFKVDGSSGCIKIYPKFASYPVGLNLTTQSTASNSAVDCSYQVKFLPPYIIKFTLPKDYPSSKPPSFTLSCIWLAKEQISQLSSSLNEIWIKTEGNVVLFEWFQYLEDDSLSTLNITNTLEIGIHLKENENKDKELHDHMTGMSGTTANGSVDEAQGYSDIITLLLVYNQMKEEEKFNSSVFDCNICFESKVGSQCSQFKACSHVYCTKCLSSYFEVLITDGSVKALNCPNTDCESQALPNQVQQLVSKESYTRYERLLLQTTLDTMNDIMYCPLSHCQSPVIIDQNENMGQCPSCSYAFCVFCKLTYHGVSPCKVSSGEIKKLVEEYRNADPGRRQTMERRYGVKVLRGAIEEMETQKWLSSNSKACPGCGAYIELFWCKSYKIFSQSTFHNTTFRNVDYNFKIDGCNKMTCYKCRAYFCWLCQYILNKENPYAHFSNARLPCYNRLFEGVDVEAMEFFL